jgi:hypothetical protein
MTSKVKRSKNILSKHHQLIDFIVVEELPEEEPEISMV